MTMNIEPLNVFQKLHQCYSYFSVLNYNRRKNFFVILVWMTIYKSKLLTFAKLVKIRRHSVEPVPNNTLDKNYSENINYVEKYKTSLSICKALGTFLGNLNKKVFILTNTYSRPKFTCPSPFCDFFYNCTIDNDEMKKSKIFFIHTCFHQEKLSRSKLYFLPRFIFGNCWQFSSFGSHSEHRANISTLLSGFFLLRCKAGSLWTHLFLAVY